jgi:hypothetical protein
MKNPMPPRYGCRGSAFQPGSTLIMGTEQTTPSQQRTVSLAFKASGILHCAYAPQGRKFTYRNLPQDAHLLQDREAFVRHARGLIRL